MIYSKISFKVSDRLSFESPKHECGTLTYSNANKIYSIYIGTVAGDVYYSSVFVLHQVTYLLESSNNTLN